MNKQCDEEIWDQAKIYEIRIKNHLDEDWSEWFDSMLITPEPEGITLISGKVEDQAELYGILKRVHQLGLRLISVNKVETINK